jgi:hypothetical protein
MNKVDELHSLVSGAIWRAEQAEVRGAGDAAEAWAEVSSLEEKLAHALPVSAAEGRSARRGAVRAAIKAGDYQRGQGLAECYMVERGAPASFTESLQEIVEENIRASAVRSR